MEPKTAMFQFKVLFDSPLKPQLDMKYASDQVAELIGESMKYFATHFAFDRGRSTLRPRLPNGLRSARLITWVRLWAITDNLSI